MRNLTALAVLSGITLFTTLCFAASKVDLSKLPPASSRQGLSYQADIKPLLDASCIRCHGPEKPKAGLRLDSLEGILKGSKEDKVVKPGDGTKSLIVLAASQLDPELSMPPKPRAGKRGPGQKQGPADPPSPGPGGSAASGSPGAPGRPPGPPPKPLTAEQVGLLRAWVDQGAK